MSRYTYIIDKLREATGPDRELDAVIAFETGAFDYKLKHGFENCRIERGEMRTDNQVEVIVANKGKLVYTENYDRYTSSIDACVALVERILPGWWYGVAFDGTSFEAAVMHSADNRNGDGYVPSAAKAPIAILLALFQALHEKEIAA